VRSLSPSDTECSTSEFAVCYSVHATAEEDDIIEDREQNISENGQEVLLLLTYTVTLDKSCS